MEEDHALRIRPNYGLDAPGAARGLLLAGVILLPAGWIAAGRGVVLHPVWLNSLGVASFNIGFGCLCGAALMFYSSYIGKFRQRDSILRRLHLRGDETILDVGCGHGLLLIAAAKQLPHGLAVGIDLWSQKDQSSNSRDATLRNAELEGVASRMNVRDGDMRKLPFADCSFDAAVAHFAIHNIPGHDGRREAIREIVRVLKPGGQVALFDLKSVGLYADELRKSGMNEVKISSPSFWTWPPSRTVTARRPGATTPSAEWKK
ncbi:MAG TPA: class I SAM-dependent methyltransferase [Candidatus Acidoferrales bacterium]|nr:class I SAM-dependent methyltransferase [Candidatus Acidoferrales bacterium]